MQPDSPSRSADPAQAVASDPETALAARREKRRRGVRVFAVIAFIAMLVFVPLGEKLPLEKAYAFVIVGASTMFLLCVTRRITISLLTPALLFSLLKGASMLKLEFLMTPALAPDLEYYLNWQTIELIARYPILLAFTLGMVLIIPLVLVPSWIWDRPLAGFQRHSIRNGVLRVLGAGAAVGMLGACVTPTGPFSGVFNKPMWATVTDRSYLTAFFTSFSDTEVERPKIAANVDRSISWKLDKSLRAPPRRPDVVAVLEESTFNPMILDVCQNVPECKIGMFKADAHTRAGGPLTVHTFGGGTWTSEFALMTGVADVLFGNAGLYAPYSLSPRIAHTLPDVFKAAGYRVIAIYSHSGEFLNARNAYANYGVDAFYDGSDHGLGWKSTDAELLAYFTEVYNKEVAENADRPLFIFTLTLHQHGPHMTPLEQLPAPFNKPLFPGKFKTPKLDEWLNLNLGNYLARAHESSAMLADLEKLLWGSGRPSVLMHFGDHQPSFDGAMHSIPKTVPKAAGPNSSRVTYYMLKTSFPMPKMPTYEALDIVFLGAQLLDAAGVPKDAFYQANALLRDRCKGRYLDCKDSKMLTSYHDYIFNTLENLQP
jgi:phosphoglycerol transferase MdoB-like AlkP superfamily enzyme